MSEGFLAYERNAGSPKPTLHPAINYDFAKEIDEKNGWVEPGEIIKSEVPQEMFNLAAEGINEIIQFCFEGQKLDPRGKGLRTAIRRFVSVCWVLKSQALLAPKGRGKNRSYTPISLAKLGKQPQVRCTRCTLSLLAQEFGRRWGFRARVQKMETTKPNYAHAARQGWKKRRQRQEERRKVLEDGGIPNDACYVSRNRTRAKKKP